MASCTSSAQMPPCPVSFLLASLFSPHLKTILSNVDVQVSWLVVHTQSAMELWVKCSSVLSLAQESPTLGPGGREHPICLLGEGTSVVQLESKLSRRQVVL